MEAFDVVRIAGWILVAQSVLVALCILYCVVGRHFGFYHPDHYRLFLLLPWRPFYRAWTAFKRWRELFFLGRRATAKWAKTLYVLSCVYKPGRVILGRARILGFGWFQPVGAAVSRHLCMVAATGAGKTVQLQTILGTHDGAALLVDPKYQALDTMGEARKRVGPVFKLTPQRPGSHSWNYFHEVRAAVAREGEGAAVRYFALGAEAMRPREPHEKPFWVHGERNFFGGLLGFEDATEKNPSLVGVRDKLTQGVWPDRFENKEDAFEFLLDEMAHCNAYDGFVSKAAIALKNTGSEARGNILQGLRGATKWLDYPEIRACMRSSDFLLSDLKSDTDPATLFVGAPIGDIQGPFAPWFRVVVMMGLTVFEHIEGGLQKPCLFALDEMPSLGRIEQLETAAAVLRSYGVRLLAITQDIDLLRKSYPETWTSFLGNADVVWWMGTSHQGNIEHLSKILGTTTRKEKSGFFLFRWFSKSNPPARSVERPLMYPEQIRRFLDPDRGNVIVTRNGKRPMLLRLARYFEDLPVWAYSPDPNHRETRARHWMRAFLERRRAERVRPETCPE